MILSESELDLLLALSHFRMLSEEQIRLRWYTSHTVEGFRSRIRKLVATKFLAAQRRPPSDLGRVFSLSTQGIRKLREMYSREVEQHRPPSQFYQLHLIETNEICLRLGAKVDGLRFARLPFTWHGSHEMQFHFTEGGSGRNRRLRPDATLAPEDGPGGRVFVELDRSTECIKKRSRRRSIEGKLDTYREFLSTRSMNARRPGATWYEDRFHDGRTPSLVFVLTKRDARSKLAEFRHRRIRNIMHTAREVCPRVDVHCVYLDDVPALRSLFSRLLKVDLESDSAPDAPSDEGRTSAWSDFLDVSLRMHRAIKSVFPTIAPGHHRDAFRDCANDFRVHLRKQRQLAQEFRRTN